MMEDWKSQIIQLRQELEQHNYRYYVLSDPVISDREFDEMMHQLQTLEEAHPEMADPLSPTQRVGSDLSKEFEQVVLTYPSLPKRGCRLATPYVKVMCVTFMNVRNGLCMENHLRLWLN